MQRRNRSLFPVLFQRQLWLLKRDLHRIGRTTRPYDANVSEENRAPAAKAEARSRKASRSIVLGIDELDELVFLQFFLTANDLHADALVDLDIEVFVGLVNIVALQ